jgi:hypothetical protein
VFLKALTFANTVDIEDEEGDGDDQSVKKERKERRSTLPNKKQSWQGR